MIVRKLEEVVGTERDVHAETWNSRRMLLKADGTGFSLHDTLIHAGTETLIWYQHHLEAVYCIEGEGEVEVLLEEGGQVHPIAAGTLYVLDQHERHLLRAHQAMRMICIFTPALSGQEVHDENGVYPAAGD